MAGTAENSAYSGSRGSYSNPYNTGKSSGSYGPSTHSSIESGGYLVGRHSPNYDEYQNSLRQKALEDAKTVKDFDTEEVKGFDTADQSMNEKEVAVSESDTGDYAPTDYSWITEELTKKAKNMDTMTAEGNLDYKDYLKSPSEMKSDWGSVEKTADKASDSNNAWNSIETISKDFDFSNAEPLETKTVGKGPFKHEVLANDEVGGLYTPQQLRYIDNQISGLEKTGLLEKVGTAVSMGVMPHSIDSEGSFDRINYTRAIDTLAKQYIAEGKDTRIATDDAIKQVYDLAQKAKMGLAKEGVEYYKLTGDTLNNPTAVQVDNLVNNTLSAYGEGKLSDEQAFEIISNAYDVSNANQLKSLVTSPVVSGLELMGAGAAAGKVFQAGASKLAGKIMEKLLERNAVGVSSALEDKFLKSIANNQAFRNKVNLEKLEKAFAEGKKGTVDGISQKTVNNLKRLGWSDEQISEFIAQNTKTAEKSFVDAVEKGSKNPMTNLYEGHYGLDVPIEGGEIAKAASELVSDKLDKKSAAVGTVGAGTIAGANAMDTGIATDKGTTIDSADIVKQYQDNPYNGADAVKLKTLEGEVSVPPREAVAIAEAENLGPKSGYTDEVKEAAKGSSTEEVASQFTEKDVIPSETEKTDLKWYDRALDYVQALLGGRDLDNDRTISASEWYKSTIGKAFDSIKNIIPNIEARFNSLGQFTDNLISGKYFNDIKNKIIGAKNYVTDVATGERSIVDDTKEALSPENLQKAGTKVIDTVMPDWNDSAETEAYREAMSSVVSSALQEYAYGDFGPITLCKMVGSYIASTVAEMFHLSGSDLSPEAKKAINFTTTNIMGAMLAPTSTVLRNVMYTIGGGTERSIKSTYGEEVLSKPTAFIDIDDIDSPNTGYTSTYGTSETATDDKYSGYKERAKNSNIAEDYNAGMEEEANEAVSDMKVKIYKVYSSEPDYIRKAIGKILKSYKELH